MYTLIIIIIISITPALDCGEIKYMKKYLIVCAIFLLASCSGYTVVTSVANVATLAATGKTPGDHTMSIITGKDCRMFRIADNAPMCYEKSIEFAEQQKNPEEINNDNNEIIVAAAHQDIININEQAKPKEINKDNKKMIVAALYQDTTNINDQENQIAKNFKSYKQERKNGRMVEWLYIKSYKQERRKGTKDETDVRHYKKIASNLMYGSIAWAEHQITIGTSVTDELGLTQGLTTRVKKVFQNYFY